MYMYFISGEKKVVDDLMDRFRREYSNSAMMVLIFACLMSVNWHKICHKICQWVKCYGHLRYVFITQSLVCFTVTFWRLCRFWNVDHYYYYCFSGESSAFSASMMMTTVEPGTGVPSVMSMATKQEEVDPTIPNDHPILKVCASMYICSIYWLFMLVVRWEPIDRFTYPINVHATCLCILSNSISDCWMNYLHDSTISITKSLYSMHSIVPL